MSTETKSKVEQNLENLFHLQIIDTKLDKIRNVRGELPMEVSDLEDEVAGLDTRIEKLKEEIGGLEDLIKERKGIIKDSKALMKKYEAQQDNVKNNREYLAISKEIEVQRLEIMNSEKKIKEFTDEIESKNLLLDKTKEVKEERATELKEKKSELDAIISETEKEENTFEKQREKAEKGLEDRLVKAYSKIRNNFKNGLAVVTIERESCGGCFSAIPPQRQLDIRHRKKITICENCGRILIDNDLAEETLEKSGIDL